MSAENREASGDVRAHSEWSCAQSLEDLGCTRFGPRTLVLVVELCADLVPCRSFDHQPPLFSEVDRKSDWVAGAACGLDGWAVVGHGPACFVS